MRTSASLIVGLALGACGGDDGGQAGSDDDTTGQPATDTMTGDGDGSTSSGSASGTTGGSTATSGGETSGTDASTTGSGDGTTGGAGPGPNVVFVTSQMWAPRDIGGLAGADASCQAAADAAGLGGTFVAWLSDSTADAVDRLGTARGWVRPDGRPFVDAVSDLVAGDYMYPPHIDENGSRVTGQAMTGTAADGTAQIALGDFCLDFTGDNADGYGVVHGVMNYSGDSWTTVGDAWIGALVACDSPARLYCFEIDHDDPLTPDFGATRAAFVSADTPPQVDGLANMDAVCALEASDAGLGGSFKAFVATDGASAASRFDLSGDPWARVDGVPILETASELATAAELLAPLGKFADGSDVASTPGARSIYAGATTPDTPGDAASTCNDWSSTSFDDMALLGLAGRSDSTWWDNLSPTRCNTWRHVYCFED